MIDVLSIVEQALSQPLPKGNKIATHLATPYLQVNTADLAGWLDEYVRERLFGAGFEPMTAPNVQRKLKAALAWCGRINGLSANDRPDGRVWHYVLLGERLFAEWRSKGGRLPELLDFSRIRPVANVQAQGKLAF